MNKQQQLNFAYILFALVAIVFVQMWISAQETSRISYSEFKTLLDSDQIASVLVSDTRLQGEFKIPRDGKRYFVTNRVGTDIAEILDQADVEYSGAADGNWLTNLLSWIVPMLFFLGVWFFLFRRIAERQGMGGAMNIGRSKAKVYVETETGVSFEDVAGVDQAKAELQEIVSFLKDKQKYERLGARVPKGVLLVGPPGTGKTLLARAVAGEAGVVFFSISGSEFVEMFVGVGAARVRDLFEQARKAAPCIIFIDELDALGRARSPLGNVGGGHDEKEQTLNQLLAELDGFDPRSGIVLLAATNRPEILDPALLRAGRFDRQVVVDRPDKIGREAILRVHLKQVTFAQDLDVGEVAGLTPGFTGADLANLVNEAAIVATRRGADTVTMEDFTSAVERIVAGSERRSRLLNPDERRRVAYHEMGHALAAASLPGSDPVHKVSIIPRSIGALGYTLQRPTEDRFLITTDELKSRMTVLLAGRAAEDLVFGEISTGAADDLAKATDVARQIVTRFGMWEKTGQAVLEEQRASYLGDNALSMRPREYSEATAREVDLAVRELIDTAYGRAREILTARREDLEEGANLLLEKETITPEDFAPLDLDGRRHTETERQESA
ncbi:ATP-dependent zinc metalloprotease FtsH [Hoeflea prorocentri]|uniref:ATP-dependent zinc metalloprotease FtsH n=1 Tax=Hoeflea prorocentri TaxID=1922333 RepID=A0A9X3UJ56_9HYPH|nr:ATP-dependent zinc metalloprotease FtsH [Hoeflea prorocentri]MCY6379671.1 ATP-dependent zinc metalloprotease FtsH [Hoeflea prorocentri]MDA5397471.1 ATP-dependent zinc metalloprotease FtsH [Hoeflea prorocentri]